MGWLLLFIHASWLNLASFVGKACSIFERFGHSESEEPNVAGLTRGGLVGGLSRINGFDWPWFEMELYNGYMFLGHMMMHLKHYTYRYISYVTVCVSTTHAVSKDVG